MYKKGILFICISVIAMAINAQSVKELNVGDKLSLRGLSVVDDNIVWVSGSKGTVGKSIDAGKTWEWIVVKDYEKSDFRDIEAFSTDVAIIMAVAEPAYILKTINGGKSWKKVYENTAKGMFLDAMDFTDEKQGIVVGDPIDGNFFLAETVNGGDSWNAWEKTANIVTADTSEACFASSGTNIRTIDKSRFVFVSGGVSSNLFTGSGKIIKLPLVQGKTSTGANSIAIKDSLTYIVVGGDFTNDSATPNSALTTDGGKTWIFPEKSPAGYKSCVEYILGDTWICCGLTGVDITNDNGKTWKQISTTSYHACRKAKKGKAVYFSGNEGRTGMLVY